MRPFSDTQIQRDGFNGSMHRTFRPLRLPPSSLNNNCACTEDAGGALGWEFYQFYQRCWLVIGMHIEKVSGQVQLIP
jgi:hypothetical protein